MERPRRNGVNYESSTPVNPSPRTRSTVLNIRRKQIILSFKGKDVQNIGTEAWANRLYTHVKKEDETITRQDITRWMESHSWISDLNGVPKMQTPLKRSRRGNRGGSASVTPPSPVAPPSKPKSAPSKKASPKVVFPKKASPPKEIINEEESESQTETESEIGAHVAGEVRNASHVSTIEQDTLNLSEEEEEEEEEGENDEEEECGEPEENEARNKADEEEEEEEVEVDEEEDDNDEDGARNKSDEDEEEYSEEEDEEDDSEEDSNTADDEMSFASTKKTNPYNPKLALP